MTLSCFPNVVGAPGYVSRSLREQAPPTDIDDKRSIRNGLGSDPRRPIQPGESTLETKKIDQQEPT